MRRGWRSGPSACIIGAVGCAQSPVRASWCSAAYAGETLTHVVRLADGSMLRATAALRQGLNAVQVDIGDAVTLSWQPDACIVLAQ